MWCRRNSTSLTRRKTRKRKRITISPISPLNSRKLPTIARRREAALFVAVRNTGQVSAQIASSSKGRNQLML